MTTKAKRPVGRPSSYTPEMAAEIYGLLDPLTGELRYIGKANNSGARLKRHMKDRMRRAHYPLYCWINSLEERGLVPKLVILEKAQDWQEAERRLIAVSRARGDRLLNVSDGGDQPYCSAVQLRANGLALNERLKSDDRLAKLTHAKRRLGQAIRDGYANNKTRAKMRLLAQKMPSMFGVWANIPDRVE